MKRTCIYCHKPGGKGPRELRPYGPNGADVCAECVLGSSHPEREEQAKQAFAKQIMISGPLVLIAEEQAGPRLLRKIKA
jgi:hypothetical protein